MNDADRIRDAHKRREERKWEPSPYAKQRLIDKEITTEECTQCGLAKHFGGKCSLPWNKPTFEDFQRKLLQEELHLLESFNTLIEKLGEIYSTLCPLCNQPSDDAQPHQECADKEQMLADQEGVS